MTVVPGQKGTAGVGEVPDPATQEALLRGALGSPPYRPATVEDEGDTAMVPLMAGEAACLRALDQVRQPEPQVLTCGSGLCGGAS